MIPGPFVQIRAMQWSSFCQEYGRLLANLHDCLEREKKFNAVSCPGQNLEQMRLPEHFQDDMIFQHPGRQAHIPFLFQYFQSEINLRRINGKRVLDQKWLSCPTMILRHCVNHIFREQPGCQFAGKLHAERGSSV